jgi:hypothetical protein
MSILENCDEMFFGRTEKSGREIVNVFCTENAKESKI